MANMRWTVEFTVSDNWIADGFDLTQECVDRMIQSRLPYAVDGEVTAAIRHAPDRLDFDAAIRRYEEAVR